MKQLMKTRCNTAYELLTELSSALGFYPEMGDSAILAPNSAYCIGFEVVEDRLSDGSRVVNLQFVEAQR